MTLGEVSKFYELMKQKDQNAVAKKFGVREKTLKTYLHNIAIVRNICAHDEKLYDLKLNNAIIKNNIHFNYNLDLLDRKYSNGYKDLFSIIIIFIGQQTLDDLAVGHMALVVFILFFVLLKGDVGQNEHQCKGTDEGTHDENRQVITHCGCLLPLPTSGGLPSSGTRSRLHTAQNGYPWPPADPRR